MIYSKIQLNIYNGLSINYYINKRGPISCISYFLYTSLFDLQVLKQLGSSTNIAKHLLFLLLAVYGNVQSSFKNLYNSTDCNTEQVAKLTYSETQMRKIYYNYSFTQWGRKQAFGLKLYH